MNEKMFHLISEGMKWNNSIKILNLKMDIFDYSNSTSVVNSVLDFLKENKTLEKLILKCGASKINKFKINEYLDRNIEMKERKSFNEMSRKFMDLRFKFR